MRLLTRILLLIICCSLLKNSTVRAQNEILVYHAIVTDPQGKIIPWNHPDPGKAYDEIIHLVWNFWDTMRTDPNGLPYYMNHQVWRPDHNDPRGIGGDQFQMAMSSWQLLYAYNGNERVKENMEFMAEYYFSHGFSRPTDAWADIPYPYNTLTYGGVYDGDMILGKNFTQPDKAGSFGLELLNLYQMTAGGNYPRTTDRLYLETAIKIANTLAIHVQPGDATHSPLPFKVNAVTGEVGLLKENGVNGKNNQTSSYATNWGGTLELFLQLIQLQKGNTRLYQAAFDKILSWMKKYPIQNNKWGPFFEDVPGWSDTQINATTFARFMMLHPQYFSDWQKEVKNIFTWVYKNLGNTSWKKYGVTVINEQTAYRVPGNSHTARQGSTELEYAVLTGDSSWKENAIRQLNWATYMVDNDGKNRFPTDENWLTDGYGDYVRHYLRAMRAFPELAPSDENHILSSTDVIQQADYFPLVNKTIDWDIKEMDPKKIILYYRCFSDTGTEYIRLIKKPGQIRLNEKSMAEAKAGNEGYRWTDMKTGGLLEISRKNGNRVVISF